MQCLLHVYLEEFEKWWRDQLMKMTVFKGLLTFYGSRYSESSLERPPREFRKVVATRAGRLREWVLVSEHVIKQ